jgi:diacylglycerol kinase (ATP)
MKQSAPINSFQKRTMPKKTCAVILNPNSGSGYIWLKKCLKRLLNFPIPEAGLLSPNDRISHIKKALEKENINAKFMLTKRAKHATKLAQDAIKKNVDVILGVGGDGTINEIINTMAGSQVPLAIIPSGTANVLALDLKLPNSINEIVKSIVKPKTRTLYLSKAGTHYFTSFCGVGLDAAIIKTADRYLKSKFGALAYPISMVWVLLTKKQKKVAIQLDNKKDIETKWAIFLNTKHYAGPYELSKETRLHNKEKIVVIIKGINWKKGLLSLLKKGPISLHNILKTELHTYRKAIIKTKNIPIQLDGEYYKTTPIIITQDQSIKIV